MYDANCQYAIRLLNKLDDLNAASNGVDIETVRESIKWAKKYHAGQMRKSGEPFYSHPIEVAYKISSRIFNTNTIVASVLHDIVEDTEVTTGMILDKFGWRIAQMVDRLTRDRPDGSKLSVVTIINNAKKHNDIEVLTIKFFDREHNTETAGVKAPQKIKKLVDETIGNFIALASHLKLFKEEKSLGRLCASLSDTDYKQEMFSFQKQDSFQLPFLSFQNEIDHIYNHTL